MDFSPHSLTESNLQDCHDDFRNFIWVVYKTLRLDVDPLTMDIATFVQETEKTGEDIFITAMRGIGKSYINNCY